MDMLVPAIVGLRATPDSASLLMHYHQGIVFNLVIVHVGLGLLRSPSGPSSTTAGPMSPVSFKSRSLSISAISRDTVLNDLEHTEDMMMEREQAGWRSDSMAAVAV